MTVEGTTQWVRNPQAGSNARVVVVQMAMDTPITTPDSTFVVITFAALGDPTPEAQYDPAGLRSTTDLMPDGFTTVPAGSAVVMTETYAGYWEFDFMFEMSVSVIGDEANPTSGWSRQVFIGLDDSFIDDYYDNQGAALEISADPRPGMDLYIQGEVSLPTIGRNIAAGQVIWFYGGTTSYPSASDGSISEGFVRMRRIGAAVAEP